MQDLITPGKLLTMREAAALIGVSYKTVYNWRRTGELPCYKWERTVRIPFETLMRYQQREQHGEGEETEG
jgi:excisionase family DNA binding protein